MGAGGSAAGGKYKAAEPPVLAPRSQPRSPQRVVRCYKERVAEGAPTYRTSRPSPLGPPPAPELGPSTGGNVPAPAAPQGGRPSGAPSSWRRTPWAGGDCPDGVAVAAPSAAGLPPLMAPAPAVLRRTWTPEDLYSNSSVAKMAVDYWRTQGPRAQGGSRPSTSTTTTTGATTVSGASKGSDSGCCAAHGQADEH
mmetsp:Transcript_2864/g.7650  ORF Transcript_2864/g.7650 Transcript_2864/m.7650 type:complete len:195 (-) Transcript_2864:144-728(-)